MGGPAAIIKKVIKKPKPPPRPKPKPKPAPKPVVQAPAPTQAEVSQSTAMDQDGYTGVSRRVKRRGRSATIITGPTGVEEQLTLGKKSLLGS